MDFLCFLIWILVYILMTFLFRQHSGTLRPLLAVWFYFFMLFICAYSILGNKFRYLSFGLLYFLIGHSIESTIFPLEIYFNHRNYLPSIGLYYFLCLFLYQCFYRIEMSRLFIPVFGIYLSLFIFFLMKNPRSGPRKKKLLPMLFIIISYRLEQT